MSIKGKTFKKITKSYLECVEKIDTITQLSQNFEALLFEELSNSVLNEDTRKYILNCDLLKKCTEVQIKYENSCSKISDTFGRAIKEWNRSFN